MSNKELQYGLALTIGFVAFSLDGESPYTKDINTGEYQANPGSGDSDSGSAAADGGNDDRQASR